MKHLYFGDTYHLMEHGGFFQPFLYIAFQFLDPKSHFMLSITCKQLYEHYRQPDRTEVIQRQSLRFAFSPSLKPQWQNTIAWHAIPEITHFRNYIVKIFQGNVFVCNTIKTEKPTIIDKKANGGFKKLSLPDELNGRVSHFYYLGNLGDWIVKKYTALVLSDHNELFLYQEICIDNRVLTDTKKIHSFADDVIKIVPNPTPLIITRDPAGNTTVLQMSLQNPYTKTTLINAMPVRDILRLNQNEFMRGAPGYILLDDNGKCFALGDVQRNFYNEHLPRRIYALPTPIFTDIEEKILGVDQGNDFLIVWSSKKVWLIGNTCDVTYPLERTHIDYSKITVPKINGNIIQVKAGRDHILVLTDQGDVYSAGFNYAKQLARKTTSGFFEPIEDHHFKKINGLPHGVVSVGLSNDQSIFSTYYGAVFICGTRAEPNYHEPSYPSTSDITWIP